MILPTRVGECAIYAGPDAYSAPGASAVTLGRFDAVHIGHQALARATFQAAQTLPQGRAVARLRPNSGQRPGALCEVL